MSVGLASKDLPLRHGGAASFFVRLAIDEMEF